MNDNQVLKRVSNKKKKIIVYIIMFLCVLGMVGLGYGFYVYLKSRPLINIPSLSLSTQEWTSGSVTISVDNSKDNISSYYFHCDDCEPYIDPLTGFTTVYENIWQESNTLTVNSNGTYIVKVRDINGRESNANLISISNIDRISPVIYFESVSTILTGSQFSLRNGIQIYDELSGIQGDYTVYPNSINTFIPGEHEVVYTIFDKAGNTTQKRRKIVVQSNSGELYYRYRTGTLETFNCDTYFCKCASSATSFCPNDYTLNESGQCCQVCYRTCQEMKWSEWSDWTKDKITPSTTREVETKIN
ncbi:MAG: DUF5011 domain-containing protein [Firmicutes bacterium]|nr:DUF5011 domain-containing protein [Bacillota bacterium]